MVTKEETKECFACKEVKPRECFLTPTRKLERYTCHDCQKQDRRKGNTSNQAVLRERNPEPSREACKKWRELNGSKANIQRRAKRNQFPARFMLYSAKKRAKDFGLPFDLVEADLLPLPERCPVLGIKLFYEQVGRGRNDDSAALDRIIPHLGYVKGNVAIISDRANTIKNSGRLDEFRKLVSWLEKVI